MEQLFCNQTAPAFGADQRQKRAHDDWVALGNVWDDICSTVGQSTHQASRREGRNVAKHFLDADEIQILQRDCERFGKLVVAMGLHPRLTNYGHFVVSHLVELHRRFGGNISRFSGQDTEGMVRELRRQGQNSQHGGHSGKDEVTSKTISLMRRWKRRIVTFMNSFHLSNEEGSFSSLVFLFVFLLLYLPSPPRSSLLSFTLTPLQEFSRIQSQSTKRTAMRTFLV